MDTLFLWFMGGVVFAFLLMAVCHLSINLYKHIKESAAKHCVKCEECEQTDCVLKTY